MKKLDLHTIPAVAILNLLVVVLVGTLAIEIALEPTALIDGHAISYFATLPRTFWPHLIGGLAAGLLTLALAERITPSHALLKWCLTLIGTCSLLLQLFRIGTSHFNFVVHVILASVLFFTLCACVVGSSLRLRNRTNARLSILMLLAYTLNVVSFYVQSPAWLGLPLGQILVAGIFVVWLHINLRREKSLISTVY